MRYGRPKYQRGIICATLVPTGEVAGGNVSLSGEGGIASTDTTASPWESIAGIRVNADGTIDKVEQTNGGSLIFTQIDISTDWIIPNGDADSLHQFRLDVTTTNPNHLSDSLSTWIGVTAGSQSASYLQWLFRKTTTGIQSFSWTLRIRYNAGGELDNGAYSGSCENGIL